MADFLTIPQVADLLPFSEKTVRRMVKARELPAAKIRGKWVLRRRDIETWFSKALTLADTTEDNEEGTNEETER